MRYAKLLGLFLATIIGCACAQINSDTQQNQIKGSSKGTVTCKNEPAMVKLMKATPPSLITNQEVLDELVKSGDCLIMPKSWLLLEAQDPPLNQQEDHASKWTIRTPNGIVHMWGTPFGGD